MRWLGAIAIALAIVAALAAWPPAAEPNSSGRVPRVGVLWPYSSSVAWPFSEALRQGLREVGYVEGYNLIVEERWADGSLDRLPALASELARGKVDVIVAASTPAVQAARQETRTIPIVMTLISDPVASGIAASLGRPGGNVTGLSLMHPELSGKRVALLKEVNPRITRVAAFWSTSTPSYPIVLRGTETAARSLGMQVQPIEVRGPGGLDNAFAALLREQVTALVVLPDPMFRNQHKRIIELAAQQRLPTMYWSRELVDAGGLMSYGASIPDIHRRAAVFVDKILKGARPGELPVEQPTKFELVINLKTARALGLTISQSLLQQADQAIE